MTTSTACKRILLLATVLIYMAIAGDERISMSEVPEVVLSAFRTDYPQVQEVGYSRESDQGRTIYEMAFVRNNRVMEVSYHANGQRIDIEEEMSVAELPAAVTRALAQHYSDYKVEAAARITGNTAIRYEVELSIMEGDTEKTIELFFDTEGNVVPETP